MELTKESDLTVVAKRAEKDFSEKEFLKDVLVKLSVDISTPPDILTAEFSEITEGESLVLKIDARADISYSCLIGTDREEEYIDLQETGYLYDKKKEIVKKKRTVIDWLPHSGTASSSETVYVCHDSESVDGTDSNFLGEVFNNLQFKDSEEDDYHVSSLAISVAKKIAIKQCYKGVYISGDHIENEHVDGEAYIKEVSGAIVPEYYLTYKYKDREYFASSFASGRLKSDFYIPEESDYIKTDRQIIDKTKAVTYVGIFVFLAGIVLAICSFFVSGIGKWYILPIVAGILIMFINFCVIRQIMRNKAMKEKKNQKYELLERLILKFDLPPLTQQELKYFNKK